jgi:hypothetical protein
MSLPVGRILRGTGPRTRILGILSALGPTTPSRLRARDATPSAAAGFHTTPAARRQDGKKGTNGQRVAKKNSTDSEIAAVAGSFARTDSSVTIEQPPDDQLPTSRPVAGAERAGPNVSPTLATFSLQGKVGVVTGGARGLGLVMGRELSRVTP